MTGSCDSSSKNSGESSGSSSKNLPIAARVSSIDEEKVPREIRVIENPELDEALEYGDELVRRSDHEMAMAKQSWNDGYNEGQGEAREQVTDEVLELIDQRIGAIEEAIEDCDCDGCVDGTVYEEDLCDECYSRQNSQSMLLELREEVESSG